MGPLPSRRPRPPCARHAHAITSATLRSNDGALTGFMGNTVTASPKIILGFWPASRVPIYFACNISPLFLLVIKLDCLTGCEGRERRGPAVTSQARPPLHDVEFHRAVLL